MEFLQEGTVLRGRYKIVKLVHRGKGGGIYKTLDLRFVGRWWAIKEIFLFSRDQDERQRTLTRFQKESADLVNLSHPSLAKVVDFFGEEHRLYLVMEYIEGRSLAEILEAHPVPLPEKQVLIWGIQLASALHFLHFQAPHPFVFQNLSPSAVMVTNRGETKLVNFGIARVLESREDVDTSVAGKMGYVAPELFENRGEAQSLEAPVQPDVYSLGVLLHFLLTKRDPTLSPFVHVPVGTLNPRLSQKTEKVIDRATQQNPVDRYQSLLEMKKDLEECLGAIREPVAESSPLSGSWQKFLWWISILLLGSVILLWYFLLRSFF